MVQKDLYNLIAAGVVAAAVSGTVTTASLVAQTEGSTQPPPTMDHSAPTSGGTYTPPGKGSYTPPIGGSYTGDHQPSQGSTFGGPVGSPFGGAGGTTAPDFPATENIPTGMRTTRTSPGFEQGNPDESGFPGSFNFRGAPGSFPGGPGGASQFGHSRSGGGAQGISVGGGFSNTESGGPSGGRMPRTMPEFGQGGMPDFGSMESMFGSRGGQGNRGGQGGFDMESMLGSRSPFSRGGGEGGGTTHGGPMGGQGSMMEMMFGGKAGPAPKLRLPSLENLDQLMGGKTVTLSETERTSIENASNTIEQRAAKLQKAWTKLKPKFTDGNVTPSDLQNLTGYGRKAEKAYRTCTGLMSRLTPYEEVVEDDWFAETFEKVETTCDTLGENVEEASGFLPSEEE